MVECEFSMNPGSLTKLGGKQRSSPAHDAYQPIRKTTTRQTIALPPKAAQRRLNLSLALRSVAPPSSRNRSAL